MDILGSLSSRWSGRWGERSTTEVPCKPAVPGSCLSLTPFNAGHFTGGSFDFNRWDLVQARQMADIRLQYHLVKNYNLLGRLDTMFVKEADAFAIYRPWYDAFADLKHRGTADPGRQWPDYVHQDVQQQFIRNDLREYYAQLIFTDSFSARIGKQQVIWSEADALAGSDIINPNDLRFHWTHFESPEDLRRNLRMVKFNYILPDFLKTASNELEAFVIPGDWEGGAGIVNNSDPRSPYMVNAEITVTEFNDYLVPQSLTTIKDFENHRSVPAVPGLPFVININKNSPAENIVNIPSNSLDNSEFGVRYSTLLPIGNGLQTSLIYLYMARFPKVIWNNNWPSVPGDAPGRAFLFNQPGIVFNAFNEFGPPPPPFIGVGTVRLNTREYFVRSHFIGITGTYYDKDLTDIVYRYDFAWMNKVGVNQERSWDTGFSPIGATGVGGPNGKWTQFTRWILAADRPTYIPWISKQHTFITGQYVLTWYPDRPINATPFIGSTGRVRELSNFAFLAATNWVMGGLMVTTNAASWDIDDTTGNVFSVNTYRYSQNILLGLNAIWYLGRTHRSTDPFAFSGNMRMNEVEFRFTYEI